MMDDIIKKFSTPTLLEQLKYKLEKRYEELKVIYAIKDKVVDRQKIINRNEEILESLKHKPIYSTVGSQVIYFKREMDDDFLFRKTKSISINAAALEKCDIIVINIVHRGVKIMATKEDIKAYRDVKTFHNECKYYYPIGKWEIIQGDMNWVEKVVEDFGNPIERI